MVEGSGFLMRGPLHLSRGEFLKVFFLRMGLGRTIIRNQLMKVYHVKENLRIFSVDGQNEDFHL